MPTEMEAQVPLLDEAFKTFSSLTYVTLFLKGRKVQLTQRLFHEQVLAIPLLYHYQLSR